MSTTKSRQSNFINENYNPCIKESVLVNKCLDTNLYDYAKCYDYFENYRRCKKFWVNIVEIFTFTQPNTLHEAGKVSRQRKSSGIEPILPTKEERDKILQLKKKGIHVFAAGD